MHVEKSSTTIDISRVYVPKGPVVIVEVEVEAEELVEVEVGAEELVVTLEGWKDDVDRVVDTLVLLLVADSDSVVEDVEVVEDAEVVEDTRVVEEREMD